MPHKFFNLLRSALHTSGRHYTFWLSATLFLHCWSKKRRLTSAPDILLTMTLVKYLCQPGSSALPAVTVFSMTQPRKLAKNNALLEDIIVTRGWGVLAKASVWTVPRSWGTTGKGELWILFSTTCLSTCASLANKGNSLMMT